MLSGVDAAAIGEVTGLQQMIGKPTDLAALLALRQWGEKYGLGVASNPVLVDRRDRLPVRPIAIV